MIFFLYAGKNNVKNEKCSAEDVVLRLLEGLPQQKNYKLYFDNWFCTLKLMLKLKSMGILTTATIRTNRTAGCPLLSEKDLKKNGRGSVSFKCDMNSGLAMVW